MSKVTSSRGVIVSTKSSSRVHVGEFSREYLSLSHFLYLTSIVSKKRKKILRNLPVTRDARVDRE